MICPHCRADNAEDSERCAKCGADLRLAEGAQTVDGTSASPVELKRLVSKLSAASALLSPTPEPSSSTVTSGGISASPGISSPALAPGAEFGPRYQIESLLGEGGMGSVYKAYDRDLGRTVAIKFLKPALASEPRALQRFKQELLLASKITHKNILRIHDLADVGGVKFITMAHVEGEDLHRVLKSEGRLPVGRALKIACQLCEALAAAHAEGIAHRDLKPQNVLLDRSDNVYVSDFGLAKSLEAGAAGMTRTGELLGTPRYMSPEQVEGKPADHRSDLYAFGLILYEMVAGEAPFAGESVAQIMFQRVREKPRNPKLLNPELPDYLVRVIMRCLEKDPAQRYQSAREILDDLGAERAPSSARSVQISLPLPHRLGWRIGAGAVLFLLLFALAIPSVRNFVLRRPPRAAATPVNIPSLVEGRYLAVLPFRVLGDQASLSYIDEGLVEALTAKLFQLKDVHVASPSAVEKAAKKESLEKIARALGVNLIVHGTLQGNAEKVRIIVNLENVVDGRRLWSQEFSGVPRDLLTLEDQIYAKVVDALELKPSSEELGRSAMHPTENIEAYDLYLKGRNSMRGQQDVGHIETAIRFYESALAKDPGFALAYAGLADANFQMYREKRDSFWADRALGAAQQAQRLNRDLPEVHFALGSVYNATGKVAEAIAELKRAVELAPSLDEGYRRLGNAYLASGRKEEALDAFRKAIRINSYYWLNHNELGSAYLRLGETEKALASYRRVTELEPDNFFGYANIGSVYFRQGKYDECIPAFQKALQLQRHFAVYTNLGTAYFYLRNYAEAVRMFEKAVEMNPNAEVAAGNLADAYRWSGQRERAAATYEKAISLAYKELQVNPRKASALGHLAQYYAKKGDANQALQFIRRARAIDRTDVRLIYEEAVVHALAGRPTEALKCLGEAFQKGYSPEEAKKDPELKVLQSHPEFGNLVREFTHKTG